MRSELRRSGHLRQVVVEPLDAEGTDELGERTLGSAAPTLRRAIFDRTDGIPLYVTELAAALVASGRLHSGPAGMELLDGADVPLPDNVRDAVLLQAADLSDDARTAAIAAAVVGQIFDPELVRAVAGLDTWPDELLSPKTRRAVGRRRWPAGNVQPRHLPQRRHRRRPLLNASLQRLICARQGVSEQHSACWRPRDSRRATHSASTCKPASLATRETPGPGWAKVSRGSSWFAPVWRWRWKTA